MCILLLANVLVYPPFWQVQISDLKKKTLATPFACPTREGREWPRDYGTETLLLPRGFVQDSSGRHESRETTTEQVLGHVPNLRLQDVP